MKIKNTKTRTLRVVLYVVLILLAFLMLVPFAWMLSASFKLDKDVFIFPIQWIPANPRWQNYVDIWRKIPLLKFVLNTVKLTLIVTFLQLLTSSFAAYAFSKLHFKGKNALFLAYIATIAVPWQVYMVPQFMMMRGMGLADTHLAIIFLQAFSAFGVFMMKQFYDTIPEELSEAARLDGLSEFGIYLRIMLPLSGPSIAALGIITFTNTWNDFMGPLMYLRSPELWTIQLGLKTFISQNSANYAMIMTGSVMSVIPILIVFLIGQKQFIEGIATSGMKG